MLFALSLNAAGFTAGPSAVGQSRVVARSTAAPSMILNPNSLFGGIDDNEPGDSKGQVAKFQKGSDFLFFQSPAPLTSGEFMPAKNPPPNFFSAENFSDLEITGPQIGVTVTGIGSAVALGGLLFGAN